MRRKSVWQVVHLLWIRSPFSSDLKGKQHHISAHVRSLNGCIRTNFSPWRQKRREIRLCVWQERKIRAAAAAAAPATAHSDTHMQSEIMHHIFFAFLLFLSLSSLCSLSVPHSGKYMPLCPPGKGSRLRRVVLFFSSAVCSPTFSVLFEQNLQSPLCVAVVHTHTQACVRSLSCHYNNWPNVIDVWVAFLPFSVLFFFFSSCLSLWHYYSCTQLESTNEWLSFSRSFQTNRAQSTSSSWHRYSNPSDQ